MTPVLALALSCIAQVGDVLPLTKVEDLAPGAEFVLKDHFAEPTTPVLNRVVVAEVRKQADGILDRPDRFITILTQISAENPAIVKAAGPIAISGVVTTIEKPYWQGDVMIDKLRARIGCVYQIDENNVVKVVSPLN